MRQKAFSREGEASFHPRSLSHFANVICSIGGGRRGKGEGRKGVLRRRRRRGIDTQLSLWLEEGSGLEIDDYRLRKLESRFPRKRGNGLPASHDTHISV